MSVNRPKMVISLIATILTFPLWVAWYGLHELPELLSELTWGLRSLKTGRL